MNTHYPEWTCSYAGEEFDRIQSLAQKLTDQDRAEGKLAPLYGYSAARFDDATKIVRDSKRYAKSSGY